MRNSIRKFPNYVNIPIYSEINGKDCLFPYSPETNVIDVNHERSQCIFPNAL